MRFLRSVGPVDAPSSGVKLRLSVLAACLGGLALAAMANAGGGSRSPVVLRTSVLLTPVEAAGTGLAPELKVRVSLDERGRVGEVDIVEIEPSSEFDPLFERVTVENLRLWRFAPALAEDGQPTPAQLEWTIQFQAREGPGALGEAPPNWLERDREGRDDRLLDWSAERRKELLMRYSKVAEALLDPDHRHRYESPRFVVVSDAENQDIAKIVAGNLEALFRVLNGLLKAHVAPQPLRHKVLVYLFARRSSFGRLQASLGIYERIEGLYASPGLLAFHLNQPSSAALLRVLLHEACHAYADLQLAAPSQGLPEWMSEGFAEYIANSDIKKGRLIPGRTVESRAVLHPTYGVFRQTTSAGATLEEVKRAVREGRGLSVEELLLGESGGFYGARHPLYYQTSWLLVHFLRDGEEGWAEQAFPRLMLYLAEGYPARAVIEATHGVDPADLEESFRGYVKRF